MSNHALSLILHFLFFPGGLFALVIGLFLLGIDRKAAARLQRRVGPPLWQPFIDLVKLGYKETLIPRTAHKTAFQLAPVLGFAGVIATAVLIPIPGVYAGLGLNNDLLMLIYLLAIPAMAVMMAGSSSSSPFGAIGFSREMTIMMAYEIPLVLIFLTLALHVGGGQGTGAVFSLGAVVNYQLTAGGFLTNLTLVPAALALLCYIPGTMGVVPFDMPEAETEIVEGPLVEYSGLGLAFFKAMNGVKLYIVLALVVGLLFPATLPFGPVLNLIWFLLKMVVLMLVVITLLRTSTGRMRIDQAFKFYLIPGGLAALSLILTLAWGR